MLLHHMLYASTACPPDPDRDLPEILRVSQKNNRTSEVTGFLYFENRIYLQYLEGREADVRGVLERIGKDTRHSGIKTLSEGPIPRRYFEDWKMGLASTATMPLSDVIGAPIDTDAFSDMHPFDLVVFMAANSHTLMQTFQEDSPNH